MAATKEYRDGYIVKSRTEGRVIGKLPFYCPYEKCGRVTDTLDDKHLREHGVCAHCYITLVEDRAQPLIDVEMYKKRLQERGF